MGVNAGLFTSERETWRTPKALYGRLVTVDGRFDVSDRHTDAAGIHHFDGLSDLWPSPWYCNPPYGREIVAWTVKMRDSGDGVALLPARTDTTWYQENVAPFASVEFIRGRLKFDDQKNSAPFPSCLAWYGPVGFSNLRSMIVPPAYRGDPR